jgi:hypothetical protein
MALQMENPSPTSKGGSGACSADCSTCLCSGCGPCEGAAEGSWKGNPKNTDPTGGIAKSKDGTYSHAKGHSGACSNHGGVGEWLDKKE